MWNPPAAKRGREPVNEEPDFPLEAAAGPPGRPARPGVQLLERSSGAWRVPQASLLGTLRVACEKREVAAGRQGGGGG